MAESYVISLPAANPLPAVRINSHASTWKIIDTLAAAGWGELRRAPQSVRSYLLALGQLADARTGVAEITDAQAAERAGVSTRTVERARKWLVGHDVVRVLRRGARRGLVGVASLLSIGKATLVAMLPGARAAKDGRARRRAGLEGGARHVPNPTSCRPFPPLREKTAGPRKWGVRPGPSSVQDELRAERIEAAASPARPETIAAARAAIAAARSRLMGGMR